ncbi:cytochrome P450 [Polyplosphaeria fusca]|uniref:Cytochrome P450 n=1 Tax=Polyplosphaeria fusca TaxID=682080 RepID=A0A9P4V0Q2_9PLEO|nr:cytochrome P450 [Polyplosphaeria fusca]
MALEVLRKVLAGIAIFLIATLSYALLYGLYNIFLHPLRKIPGPLLRRAYAWPNHLDAIYGVLTFNLNSIHKKYGPIVRVGPNELSYTDSRAYKPIYASHSQSTEGFSEMKKNPEFEMMKVEGVTNILAGDVVDHARFRKMFSHSFSEKGIREMQPRIRGYVDQLVQGLKDAATSGPVDVVKWYNWTTFDLIGDLAFGESFHCIRNQETDPWIAAIFGSVKFLPIATAIEDYGLGTLLKLLMPRHLLEMQARNAESARKKMRKRIQKGAGQYDFWDNAIQKSNFEKGTGMTEAEMVSNSYILALGGSETTATALSGVTYLLLKHPNVLKELNAEVRGAFKSEEDIDLVSVGRLEYMLGTLNEAVRLYPPTPSVGNRIVPPGGAQIIDKWVPGGTSVQVQTYSTLRSLSNFARPEDFCPERWLSSAPAEFAKDDRAAFQPFSSGPRNCIGRNLAYAELRLILAKVCWNFDMKLDEEKCSSWMESQKIFILWEKTPLWVNLTPVQR